MAQSRCSLVSGCGGGGRKYRGRAQRRGANRVYLTNCAHGFSGYRACLRNSLICLQPSLGLSLFLETKKPRHRDVQEHAPGHTARKWRAGFGTDSRGVGRGGATARALNR